MKNAIEYKRSLEYCFPDIAKQWHPYKNGELLPKDVTFKSNKKVWWYLPYDDPITGKHFDFEWMAMISSKVTQGVGCPFLSGNAVWPGFNDLATRFPEIARQWHQTKNGDLKPENVTASSNKKVWWLLPYYDPIIGKHFIFEWQSTIDRRTRNNAGCPYLSNQAVWIGFNDLATMNPDVAKEWHPTKNGDLTPEQIVDGSEKVVWWYRPYDDPITGKHFDFEWKCSVYNRAKKGADCPFLTGKAVWPGFNDLATKEPELAKEWHPIKNGDLTPIDITSFSNKIVWWLLSYDDPITMKHFDFEWSASINSRVTQNLGCPYLSGKAVWQGFNDLATKEPEIAKEWHPTKNGNLTPRDVTALSNKNVWWFLPYYDQETGEHYNFEWRNSVHNRVSKAEGCPFLTGRAVWPGYNDLVTKEPDVAAQWHPTKNGELRPADVTVSSNKVVWWLCFFEDISTGKSHVFEWKESIVDRVKHKNGCPYLTGHRVWPGYNDIFSTVPYLQEEWDYEKNKGLNPCSVTAYSHKKAWWKCDKCGKSWRAVICSRTMGCGHGC